MIGLYGGTFDPIHLGHLNLALGLKEKCALDEVWLIPTSISPLRLNETPIEPKHRLKMAELAIEGLDGFKVVTLELEKVGPCYTIDTVRELKKKFPQKEFALLLGSDAAITLPNWKEGERLIEEVKLFVGSRFDPSFKEKMDALPPPFSKKMVTSFVETDLLDIEAKKIRKRLKNKLYCAHLLPSKVLDYIYENQLYFSHNS